MGACSVDHGVVGTNWGQPGAFICPLAGDGCRSPPSPPRGRPAVSHGDVTGKPAARLLPAEAAGLPEGTGRVRI